MSKKNQRKKQKNQQIKLSNKPAHLNKWLSIAAFIAVGFTIFYPPFFRGLFFPEDMFVYHIFTALAFILVWVDKIHRKDYSFLQSPLDIAVLAYATAYLLSLLGAVHPGEAFYGFLKALNFFMVYWMVTQVVKDYRAYENILRVLLAAGVGVAVIGIMAATGYSNYPSAFDGRQIMSTLQYTNATAAYLAVLSFIGITLWIREKNLVMKLVYGLSTYIMILVVLGAVSKGAWLIFIAGAILLLIGMPGIYRLKSIYNLGIAIAAAVITASRFIPAITGENQASGLPLVLIGVLIILAGQGLWEALQYLYQNKGKKITSLVIIGLLLIGIITVLIPLKAAVSPTSTSLTPDNIATEISQITDLQDSSYITRYDFARWGLAIVKDYPIVGTGAGGWNALYHQYQDYLFWTTEAHNHFIQVWVEAGTIGFLAFLSMWILLLLAVYKVYKVRKQKDIEADDKVKAVDQWILTWGTASTALAFGLHASFDFDLSLAALAILLWVLFALINSITRIEAITCKLLPEKPVINIAIASILVLVILICGSSYIAAHSACQQGDKVIQGFPNSKDAKEQNEKLTLAEKKYTKAVSLDSHSATYHANLAQVYAIRVNQLCNTNQAVAQQYYQRAIKEITQAEKLKSYDIRIRNSLLNTCSKLGNVEGIIRQAEASLKASPNDINAYIGMGKVLWGIVDNYFEAGQYDKAKEYSKKLVNIENQIEQQKVKLNPDRVIWQGKELRLTPELRMFIGKANYLLGDYQAAIDKLEPLTANLLALEFNDVDFEKTEFENENWKVSVVADKDAANGKCVQMEAKKDMVNYPTAITIAKEIPVKPGYEYKFDLRYKVLNCEDNPVGEYAHNKLAVWSHWHTNEKSIPRDLIFWDDSKSSSSNGWQVYTNIDRVPTNVTHRHFYLGTGSVRAGTVYRVDYMKYTPLTYAAYAGTEHEDDMVWYAAALARLGQSDQVNQIIKEISSSKVSKLFNKLVEVR